MTDHRPDGGTPSHGRAAPLLPRRNLRLFVMGTVCLAIVGGTVDPTFNNYLNDVFRMTALERGKLEFPREMPGFLTALFAGILFFLPETRIAAASSLAIGAAMFGLAFCGSGWTMMLALVILWNTGLHLLMPVRSSIAMELAHETHKGRMLGLLASVGIAASIIGSITAWTVMKLSPANYRLTFIIGGCIAVCAAAAQFLMRMPAAHLQRPKFVWHKSYWVYYVLAVMSGARKQVFITFGPLVLIKVFDQPPQTFAELAIAGSVLGMVVQPVLGRSIDRFGERAVLMVASVCVALVCVGYGFAHLLGSRSMALGLLYVCYVGDQLLFGANMARDTYLSKIAVKPAHVSPTLSLGITIDHVVSMTVPALGGWMWVKYGYSHVFVAAAGVALLTVVVSALVRTPLTVPKHHPLIQTDLP